MFRTKINFPNKIIFEIFFKTKIFVHLNTLQHLNKNFNITKIQKKYVCLLSFICHIGYPCTCFGGWAVPVSVQDNFWQVFGKGWINWFLLILQTAQPSTKKESCCLVLQDFRLNISCPFDMIMATKLKYTRRCTCMGCRCFKKTSWVFLAFEPPVGQYSPGYPQGFSTY